MRRNCAYLLLLLLLRVVFGGCGFFGGLAGCFGQQRHWLALGLPANGFRVLQA